MSGKWLSLTPLLCAAQETSLPAPEEAPGGARGRCWSICVCGVDLQDLCESLLVFDRKGWKLG